MQKVVPEGFELLIFILHTADRLFGEFVSEGYVLHFVQKRGCLQENYLRGLSRKGKIGKLGSPNPLPACAFFSKIEIVTSLVRSDPQSRPLQHVHRTCCNRIHDARACDVHVSITFFNDSAVGAFLEDARLHFKLAHNVAGWSYQPAPNGPIESVPRFRSPWPRLPRSY